MRIAGATRAKFRYASEYPDAGRNKSTPDTHWLPGANNLGSHRRQAFAEFTEVYQIEADFQNEVETGFGNMINRVVVETV